MRKTLLLLFALILVSHSSFALRLNLTLDDLNSGFGDATYNAETKTITYPGAWGGRGWWLGSVDYSLYQDVTVKFAATDATVKLVVNYSDDTENVPAVYANAGATSIKVTLDPSKRHDVKQIYLQRSEAGTLVLEEAYLTGASVPSLVIDFEDKEIGDTYSIVGWSGDAMTATVAANPSGEGKSLHAVGANWNSYPKFTVTLPEGKTLGDIQKITFDIYFSDVEGDQNTWKKIDYFFGAVGVAFAANAPTGTTEENVILNEEAKATWLHKEFSLPATLPDELKALNNFDFAFGINAQNTDFYLDNINFIAGPFSGLNDAKASSVFFNKNTLYLNNSGNVQIFDTNGRLILAKQNVTTLDLSSVSRGIYIAKALVDGGVEVIKFVK